MKSLILLLSLTTVLFTGCVSIQTKTTTVNPPPIQNKVIQTIGYSTVSSYKKYPAPQQRLLAIRGAKLDAYRNLAEEVYGLKIKGKTTVKDLIVENDSYRVYIDTMIRGAHIDSISEKKGGVFEAEVSMTLTPRYTSCLYNPSAACFNSANQYQAEVIDNQGESRKTGAGFFPVR